MYIIDCSEMTMLRRRVIDYCVMKLSTGRCGEVDHFQTAALMDRHTYIQLEIDSSISSSDDYSLSSHRLKRIASLRSLVGAHRIAFYDI